MLARLVGLRLLTLEASMILAPAEMTGPPPDAESRSATHALAAPIRTTPSRPREPTTLPGPSQPAVGSRLEDARRAIDESAATLAAVRDEALGGRHNGRGRPPARRKGASPPEAERSRS